MTYVFYGDEAFQRDLTERKIPHRVMHLTVRVRHANVVGPLTVTFRLLRERQAVFMRLLHPSVAWARLCDLPQLVLDADFTRDEHPVRFLPIEAD